MARQIIIDTDPGTDDAVAILLALAAPEDLAVLGLTCVAGNVPLAQTALNARRVLALAGRGDIPVMAGCDRPLRRAAITATHVHGSDGLGGVDLPDPIAPLDDRGAVDFLIATLRAAPVGTITLVALGPLTNIAAAITRAPDIAGRIAEIVVMGGAGSVPGNVTPVAEFNIHADPHAAEIVLRAGATLTLAPLDVTHRVLVTGARCTRIAAPGGAAARAVAALTDPKHRESPRHGRAVPLHDPCTIAWLLAPDLFETTRAAVAVETASDLCMGQTVIDWWGVTGRAPNARILHGVDAEGVFALLTDRLARL